MAYFPKIEYWRTLVPNSGSVDETNNPYFKNTHASTVLGYETEFFLPNIKFQCTSLSLRSHQLTKYE